MSWRDVQATVALELKRTRHRAAIAVRSRTARKPVDDPVFLISAGRTGSQLLADYLNCLPGVTVLDEVLNADKVLGLPARLVTRSGVERHLRHSVATVSAPVRGAKLLLSQLEDRGLAPARLRELFPDVRFIVLYRRSLAEQYVSLQTAGATRTYAARTTDSAPSHRLRIDRDDLQRFYDRVKSRYRRVLAPAWFRERSAIVCYEELVADPGRVGDELARFLGVPATQLATTLVKQIRRPLAEIVENYDEVRDLLTGEASRHDYA